jgi:dTDP-4-dehydrorhamnose reductase
MIRAWLAGKDLRVVSDQVGSPTYTADLARVLVDLAEKNVFPGVYHAAGPEALAWNEFAGRAIRAYAEAHGLTGRPLHITAIRTEDWPTPAARPPFSVLSTEKLAAEGIAPMRPVDEALREFAARLGSDAL